MSTIIGNPIMLGGGSGISAPIIGKDFNWTGGDGTYQVLDDGDKNWRIKFLSSGTFTPLKDMVIDAFLVAAGGGGSSGGAGSGHTNTVKSIVLTANTSYSIEIGAGGNPSSNAITAGNAGGNTSAFSVTAIGGGGGKAGFKGGDGGSGGGANTANGGIDGADGASSADYAGGKGQGTTTREFGESTGDLYASGGSGVSDGSAAGADNTGDGGDFGKAGGSGIVVIRKHKEAAA